MDKKKVREEIDLWLESNKATRLRPGPAALSPWTKPKNTNQMRGFYKKGTVIHAKPGVPKNNKKRKSFVKSIPRLKSVPATDKQKGFMRSLGIKFHDNVTKKQASLFIDTALKDVGRVNKEIKNKISLDRD